MGLLEDIGRNIRGGVKTAVNKGILRNPLEPYKAVAKGAGELAKGLFALEAAENGGTQPAVIQQPPPPQETQQPQQDWLGGMLGGVGGWIGENPALFTGLATAAFGAGSGLSLGESLGLGGQAGMRVGQGQQRISEETNKLNMQLLGVLGTGVGKPLSEYYSAARAQLGKDATPEQINRVAAAIKAQDLGATLGYQQEGGFFGLGSRQLPYVQ